jgi:hypothetical protein
MSVNSGFFISQVSHRLDHNATPVDFKLPGGPHQSGEPNAGKTLLKKREKWRTPSYFASMFNDNPRYTSPVMWPTRPSASPCIPSEEPNTPRAIPSACAGSSSISPSLGCKLRRPQCKTPVLWQGNHVLGRSNVVRSGSDAEHVLRMESGHSRQQAVSSLCCVLGNRNSGQQLEKPRRRLFESARAPFFVESPKPSQAFSSPSPKLQFVRSVS